MKKQFPKPLIVIAVILALFLIVWIASLIKCEVLTNKYFDDFALAYQDNGWIDDVTYFKVLRCDGETAEVYYVSADIGLVLEFQNQNGSWAETTWYCVWSSHGSASEFVWPYWWQIFITGV